MRKPLTSRGYFSVGNEATGPLKTGMSTLFIGLELVIDKQPKNYISNTKILTTKNTKMPTITIMKTENKHIHTSHNSPIVRPWKLPLKDKILISGQPGAYKTQNKRRHYNIFVCQLSIYLIVPSTVQLSLTYWCPPSFVFL